MKIDLIWDPSVANAPADFKAMVQKGALTVEKLYSNPVTLQVTISWNPKTSGATSSFLPSDSFTYAQVSNALIATQTNTFQKTADNSLPATDPTGGSAIIMSEAEAQAIGLTAGGATVKGGAVFGPGSFDPGTVEHELTEIMGRFATTNPPTELSAMDLFRYSAPNVRDLTSPPPNPYTTAYFSVDSGTTNLGQWNTVKAAGDLGDWNPPNGPAPVDSFDYTGSGVSPMTYIDFELVNVLGWNTPIADNTVPDGITDYVQGGQTRTGFTVLRGGIEQVAGGGITQNTVLSGGDEQVMSGGSASGTTVSGGKLTVSAGGTASATTLTGFTNPDNSVLKAIEVVSGTETGTVINNSGVEQVETTGNATGDTVNNGGLEIVNDRGIVANPTINGGTLDLAGAMIANGGIIFAAGGGVLQLDNNRPLAATVSGFAPGATVDLRFLTFDPNGSTTLLANNVLQVAEGGKTYSVNLDPGQNFGSMKFALADDGKGGTNLTVTPRPPVFAALTFSKAGAPGPLPDQLINGGSDTTIVAAAGDTIAGGTGDTIDLSHLTNATGGAVIEELGVKSADTVVGFDDGVDRLSYAGETAASEAKIVAAAKLVNGNTVLTYPDHSTVTLLGVTHLTAGIFA